VTLDEVLHGAVRMIRLQRIDPRTGGSTMQTLRVEIPPGVREAQPIRLAGQGREGIGGGEPGNLYLRVKFAQHPDLRVRGADLYYDLELTPWEAVLGATIPIPTLDGRAALNIPAGTGAGRKFRLRGKGLPAGDGMRGDLYAIVSIQVPPQVTPAEKNLWTQLAARATFNPRETV
jgi:curved DNA-binding protein